MKKNGIHQPFAMAGAIMVLASLACRVGWNPIDQFYAPRPGDLDEMRQQAIEEELEREQRERELKGLPREGEFVPPVAPALPLQQSAPQAGTPAGVPLSGAPVILRTDYPAVIPADGQIHYGWIHFTDADGDLSGVKVEMTWGIPPMQGGVIDANIDGPPTAGRTRIGFT